MEDINLNPAPIQRNEFDVAVELTMYVARATRLGKQKDIQDVFLSFYSLAKVLDETDPKKLMKYIPEDLRETIEG
ncbi:hypothetical protein SAMN02745945_01546 [Peptoclostridium litorale DSM 5388]|uniref:Uncharacterized protein n=1 Tax=Peptoclostridium litorale DSM 5388 TaxID=1121324 RepID=A0A069RHT1_PEPLI|nr:hypothetical protein [Peptoclostridium litorale]KDR95695.1 hypothetical protein CLIT_10c04220 [Peptoclostridium litorale DSM 5388]SIO01290.1 hypothetical protein SAMN02745945_01546 [Peptoclostridium litorale DSM 5388]